MASYPEELKYTKDHEWTRLEGKQAKVGITSFAQEKLGDVVYVELPKVGDSLRKGEPFGVVESTKAVSELFAPVSGKVVEANTPLVDNPQTINEDPYEKGWMVKVELTNPAEVGELMTSGQYSQFLKDHGD